MRTWAEGRIGLKNWWRGMNVVIGTGGERPFLGFFCAALLILVSMQPGSGKGGNGKAKGKEESPQTL